MSSTTIPAKKPWTKETAVIFMPSRIQFYEAGIDWYLEDKTPIKIMGHGFKAPSEREENRLLDRIKNDKNCHICVYGKHEVPKEARVPMQESIALRAENDQLKSGMEALRAELEAERAKNKKT